MDELKKLSVDAAKQIITYTLVIFEQDMRNCPFHFSKQKDTSSVITLKSPCLPQSCPNVFDTEFI